MEARVLDDVGRPLAPVPVVLATDSRNPPAKHAILEMYARHLVRRHLSAGVDCRADVDTPGTPLAASTLLHLGVE